MAEKSPRSENKAGTEIPRKRVGTVGKNGPARGETAPKWGKGVQGEPGKDSQLPGEREVRGVWLSGVLLSQGSLAYQAGHGGKVVEHIGQEDERSHPGDRKRACV